MKAFTDTDTKKNSNLTFYIMQLHIVRWGINPPPPLKTPPMFFRQPHPPLNLQNVQAPSFWAIPSYILLFCGNTPPLKIAFVSEPP